MSPLSDLDRRSARRAGHGAAAIAVLAWCLVVVGALVRAHGAGLACPDWPLCLGDVVPEFDLKIAFEWGHRALAGAVSIGLVGLAAYMLANRELRAEFRASLGWVFAILGVQIVLGALTVLLGLAPWTVTAHLLTGNAFVVALLWLSRGLLESARPSPVPRAALPGASAVLAALGAVLVVVQLALGGLVASHYAGLACETFPLCNSDSLAPTLSGPIGLHVLHRLNAYLVCAAYAALAWRMRSSARTRRLALVALGLVLLQGVVGVANVLLKLPVEITALHSALASALALLAALIVREVWLARTAAQESVELSATGRQALEGMR